MELRESPREHRRPTDGRVRTANDLATEALRQAGLLGESRVVAAERFPSGKASSVWKIGLSSGHCFVFKQAHPRVVAAEALWLRAWREIGIETPEVYAHGSLDDTTPYLLMQYVAGLSVYAAIESGTLPFGETMRQTGQMLARMHAVRGTGYGTAHEDNLDGRGTGQFTSLRDQLWAEALPRGLSFGVKAAIVGDQDVHLVQRAVGVLETHARVTGPRLTHGDYRVGNMIHSGDRLVVIDPAPALTHPYVCLAYSLLLPEIEGEPFASELLAGYAEVSLIDEQALDAALVIRAGIMLNTFGRRDAELGKRIAGVFARMRDRVA